MSLLLPEGIDHLGDCPFTVHSAIIHGLRILSYEEALPDERPPKEIWMDGEKLKKHWAEIDRKHKERYGSGTADEDEGDYEENPLAAGLITRG